MTAASPQATDIVDLPARTSSRPSCATAANPTAAASQPMPGVPASSTASPVWTARLPSNKLVPTSNSATVGTPICNERRARLIRRSSPTSGEQAIAYRARLARSSPTAHPPARLAPSTVWTGSDGRPRLQPLAVRDEACLRPPFATVSAPGRKARARTNPGDSRERGYRNYARLFRFLTGDGPVDGTLGPGGLPVGTRRGEAIGQPAQPA